MSLKLRERATYKEHKKRPKKRTGLVLMAGLEPARYCYRGILSPLRLPIPPHQRTLMEVPPRLELGIRVLQTLALPLGEGTNKTNKLMLTYNKPVCQQF